MAANPPLTLDIKEPQILRHYPNDAGGFFWHHRVLLSKVGPGIFIALTPDEDLERIDLHTTDHIPLQRRSDFPAAQSPYVYAFDDISRGDLERLRRAAQGMASLYNDASLDEIESYIWMVVEHDSPQFGEEIGENVVLQGVTLGDSALVEVDGKETLVRRILASSKESVISTIDSSRGDLRILGDFRDSQQKRYLSLNDAVNLLKEEPMKDWPLQGPRVVLEFLRAVRSGPNDLTSYHLTWVKSSGVNQHSMIAHDHRILCNVLRAALEVDQINVSCLLSFEYVVRRIVQMETAVARNPQSPDFSGLELMLEDTIGLTGEANTTAFNSWLSTKLKEKAQVAKQTRLYKEEFRNQASDSAARSDPNLKGKGKGKPKAKTKSRAAPGGEGGAAD